MVWDAIFGRKELVHTLQEAVRRRKTAHAYLFSGPEGIGKKTIAAALAAALNCLHPELAGCGNCPSCLAAAKKTHPDIHWLGPEGKSVRIEQIRAVKKYAHLKPRQGRFQIFIIDQADTMTLEAANSLLKVLEEPPAGTVIVLLSSRPGDLPETVCSRCQHYPVGRLDQDSTVDLLRYCGLEAAADSALEIMLRAEGIPGRILQLADEKGRVEQAQKAAAFLAGLPGLSRPSEQAARLAEEENLPALLDTVILTLRDVLMLHAISHGGTMLSGGDRGLLERLAEIWPPAACRRALQLLLALQADLARPVNTRLLLEKALRDLKEVGAHAESCGDPL
ncbi:MAG: DNA polymerase III subunit delta' [Firmicutes bacterium]|jgi:DNA polymerase-3 subunit delta'|nr:DNA polymerase III subunit delta' [Bacillota bacterium]